MGRLTRSPDIRVEGLWKSYRPRIGTKAWWAKLAGLAHQPPRAVLRDVSFAIPAGQATAIIGVNGSGKSTLLRVLAGVTKGDRGQVSCPGRVGGIMDLMGGFHPDLTGRENIYLQGSLLGMSRSEVSARLTAIEDFSELGDFLHAPVRTYSLGMLLRLGFSIAIQSDNDVFVLDEALAVGDAYFQWKCVREIERIRKSGRTLLFVSHRADEAEALCTHALWLHEGVVREYGAIRDVGSSYQHFLFGDILAGEPLNAPRGVAAISAQARIGNGKAVIRKAEFRDATGAISRVWASGAPASITLTIEAREPLPTAAVAFAVETPGKSVGLHFSTDHSAPVCLRHGTNIVEFRFSEVPLRAGYFTWSLSLHGSSDPHDLLDTHLKIYTITVTETTLLRHAEGPIRLPVKVTSIPGSSVRTQN